MDRLVRLDIGVGGNVALVGDIPERLSNSLEAAMTRLLDRPSAAPGGLAALVYPGPWVALTWDAVAGAARYRVIRQSGLTGDQTSDTHGPAPSFVDQNVFSGYAYEYAVAAVDTAGAAGSVSSPVSVLVDPPGPPPPPPPTPPTGTPLPNPSIFVPFQVPPAYAYEFKPKISPAPWMSLDIERLTARPLDMEHALQLRPYLVASLTGGSRGHDPLGMAIKRVSALGGGVPCLSIPASRAWVEGVVGRPAELTNVCGLAGDLKGFGMGLAIRVDG